jgi:hypothetical protein
VTVTIKKASGEGTTLIKPKDGTEIVKKSTTQAVETDGTLIGFKVGHTMNLGNYESARFEVSLVLPSKKSQLNKDFKLCQEWADKKLAEVVEEAQQESK